MVVEQHIVEKVKVDIDVNSMELAEKVKSEINDFIKNEVLPIVEAYFVELNLPQELKEKVIQLDKVNLSVEASSWNTNSVQMKQEVRKELERQMNPIIEDLKERGLRNSSSVSEGYDKIREQEASVYSKEERILKSMFYFLDHGTLPWWVQSVDESREMFSETSLIEAIREKSTFAKTEFFKRRNRTQFKMRLIQQFPTTVVAELIQVGWSRQSLKRDRITAQIVEETKLLSREVSSKVWHLLVELSEPNSINEVFKKNVGGVIFNHVHELFYHSKLNEKELESSLLTTNIILRTAYFLADREADLGHVNTQFYQSLEKQLSSKVLASLKETQTYRNVFLESDSGQEEPSKKGTRSGEKGRAQSPSKFTSEEKLGNEIHEDNLDITPESQVGIEEDEMFVQTQSGTSTEDEESVIEQSGIEESVIKQSEGSSSKQENEVMDESDLSVDNAQEDEVDISETIVDKDSSIPTSEADEFVSKNETSENVLSSDNTEVKPKDDSEVESEDRQLDDQHEVVQKEVDSIRSAERKSNQEDEIDSSSNRSEENRNSHQTDVNDRTSSSSKEGKKGSRDQKTDQDELAASPVNELKREDGKVEEGQSKELREILEAATNGVTQKKKGTDEIPNQMFVSNAGLVLLNPFLPALFKELKLTDQDGKLIDPELAACLLHYAATGREGDFEFEMTFEKYLCGIPPSVSLNRKIELAEAHKAEVAKVLNSVLEHWAALKSKSTELLQNEFLTRSGKLIVEKSNHRLVIEKKTFDLLLDKLPWSYSLIKFSWKKEIIFVEW